MTSPRTPLFGTRVRGFVPLTVALAIGWTAHSVQAATLTESQTAINAKLAEFAAESSPVAPGKPVAAKFLNTATADDLARAVGELLESGPGNFTPSELLVAAFSPFSGKARTDRNVAGPKVLDFALRGENVVNDAAAVAAAVDALLNVNEGTSNEFNPAAKLAVVTQALNSYKGTEDDAGTLIANAVKDEIVTTDAARKAFLTGVLRKTTNVAAAQEFAATILADFSGGAAALDANAIAIAKTLSANRAVAAEVVSSAAVNKADDDVATFAQTVLADASLRKIAADVIAALAGEVAQDEIDELVMKAVSQAKPLTIAARGQVAAGGLRALDGSAGAELILDNAQTGTTINTAANAIAFSGGAATGLTADDADKVDAIVTEAGSFTSTTGALLFTETAADTTLKLQAAKAAARGSLGAAIVKASAIGANAADVSENVFTSVAALQANRYSDAASRLVLATAIGKGAPTVGNVIGGLARGVALASSGSEAQIAISLSKSFSKSVVNVASETAALFISSGGNTSTEFIDAALSSGKLDSSTKLASTFTAAFTLGVALVDPVNAETIVKQAVLRSSKNRSGAAVTAGFVARGVDVESAAEIANALAITTVKGAPKPDGASANLDITQAAAIAAAVSKAVAVKPGVSTANRVDELGEIAASIVNGVLGKARVGATTDAKGFAAESALISSIAKSVFAAASKKLLPNVGSITVDLKDVAGDVLGSIFQTIKATPAVAGTSGFNQALKDFLLTDNGVLETALLKLLPTSVRSLGQTAINNVQGAGGDGIFRVGAGSELIKADGTRGEYEVGNLNDPETPKTNI